MIVSIIKLSQIACNIVLFSLPLSYINTIMRTIQTIKITFIALMICCNICCDNKANQELQIVEGLLNQDLLDSAYTTFNKIELSTGKTTSDSALYYLLKTEIMWQKEEAFKAREDG